MIAFADHEAQDGSSSSWLRTPSLDKLLLQLGIQACATEEAELLSC